MLASRHGDLAERVGKTVGEKGDLVGDEVVSVNIDDTCGKDVRIVVESKNRKVSLRKLLVELDQALENRGASAAIAVVAGPDNAAIPVTFQYYGNKAVVVFDPGEQDDRTLALAYMWARWIARRNAGGPEQAFDTKRVETAMHRARRALERSATIRRHHSTARRSIEAAGGELVELTAEVDHSLFELSATLQGNANSEEVA